MQEVVRWGGRRARRTRLALSCARPCARRVSRARTSRARCNRLSLRQAWMELLGRCRGWGARPDGALADQQPARENLLIIRPASSKMKTPSGGCCSTRISVSLWHYTFLMRAHGDAPHFQQKINVSDVLHAIANSKSNNTGRCRGWGARPQGALADQQPAGPRGN